MTKIGDRAYYNCTILSSVVIPDNVTEIGYDAFNGCSFTSINIPKSMATIGEEAFKDCSNLISIIIPESVAVIEAYACKLLRLLSLMAKFVLSLIIVNGCLWFQIHNDTFRPKTNNEEKWNDKWLATPWNEIEIGMGLMKGMPILLVKDPHIDMGIFDSNLSECFVANVSTDDDSRKLAQNKEVVKWLSKITL